VNATGSWSMNLVDSAARSLNMTLYQNAGMVMGYGTLATGNFTQTVTASGSVAGSTLSLYITPTDGSEVCALALALSGNSATGSYNAYTVGGQTWVGTATGTRYGAAAVTSAPVVGVPTASIVPTGITVGSPEVAATATSVTPVALPVTSVTSPATINPFNGTQPVTTSYTSTYNGMSTTTTNNGVTTVTGNGGVITSGDGTVSTSYG
jgi:hypothetical protein